MLLSPDGAASTSASKVTSAFTEHAEPGSQRMMAKIYYRPPRRAYEAMMPFKPFLSGAAQGVSELLMTIFCTGAICADEPRLIWAGTRPHDAASHARRAPTFSRYLFLLAQVLITIFLEVVLDDSFYYLSDAEANAAALYYDRSCRCFLSSARC